MASNFIVRHVPPLVELIRLHCHATVALVQSNSAYAVRSGYIVRLNSLSVVVIVPELCEALIRRLWPPVLLLSSNTYQLLMVESSVPCR